MHNISQAIPAGALNNQFFDNQRPAYMNYAAIGYMIGHEITHGFDNTGWLFSILILFNHAESSWYSETGLELDKEGNINSWWSVLAKERFDDRAECFIKQYSSYFVEEAGINVSVKLFGLIYILIMIKYYWYYYGHFSWFAS